MEFVDCWQIVAIVPEPIQPNAEFLVTFKDVTEGAFCNEIVVEGQY